MEMFYKTIVCGDNKHHFENSSVKSVIKEVLEKFIFFSKQTGYLTPFQWALMANFINRWNSALAVSNANLVKFIALNTVFSFCCQEEEGVLLNGIHITNEAIMIDLAFIRYTEKENTPDPNKRYTAINLCYRLRLNRYFKRKVDRKVLEPIFSLYLYLFEEMPPLLIRTTVKSKWLKEVGPDRVARHEVRSLQNLNSISQIIKEIVPSWERGPPKAISRIITSGQILWSSEIIEGVDRMRAKQEGYVFNLYDPNSKTIQPFSKKITHFGILDSFVVNIYDNVDLKTKAGIDEFVFIIEKVGYFSPVQCCFLAIAPNHEKSLITLEELAVAERLFGYLAFGILNHCRVDTAYVLEKLNSKKGFPYNKIYRVNDHSIIHKIELTCYQKKVEKDPERSRQLFYLSRCMHLNNDKKKCRKREFRGKGKSVSLASSYFNHFLTILMKVENVPYELDEEELKSIGAIEFEINDQEDLARITQLIKQVLSSDELGLVGSNGVSIPW